MFGIPGISLRAASAAIALGAILLSSLAAPFASTASAATSDHLMCNWKAEYRTQLVAIDPSFPATGISAKDVVAAFQPWNDLFEKYHGFPIFAVTTNLQEADVLVTGKGYDRTWVDTVCSKGFKGQANVDAIVYVGARDAWRNLEMLPHELGHALGFADHGDEAGKSAGHISYKPCGNYVGVMSYCTSSQSWFLDGEIKGLLLDGELIRDYWNN